MICAKNYENVSKFDKVMNRILCLWPLFFRTRCSYLRAYKMCLNSVSKYCKTVFKLVAGRHLEFC